MYYKNVKKTFEILRSEITFLMELYSTNNKGLSISLFMCFRIFNFEQIKMLFRGDENLKTNLYCKC